MGCDPYKEGGEGSLFPRKELKEHWMVMTLKTPLELPMCVEMGRIKYYHAMYVICWLKLSKLLAAHFKMDVNQYLTENPIVPPEDPDQYTWDIQGRKIN